MDIEKLTRSQIVLLALLVSFVSSIASSIVTMTLLDQSPSEAVPQIVNRVVERTVERVVTPVESPAPRTESPQEKVVEKTVVVREEELVPTAVAEVRRFLVAVYEQPPASAAAEDTSSRSPVASGTNVSAQLAASAAAQEQSGVPEGGGEAVAEPGKPEVRFVAFGLVVGKREVLVPDRVIFADRRYEVRWEGGAAPARVALEGEGPFALLVLEGETLPPVGKAPALLDIASFQLGQSVIVVGGVDRPTIASGIVAALPDPLPPQVASSTPLAALFPEVIINAPNAPAEKGAVVVSLFKEVVAMNDGKVYRVLTPQGIARMLERLVPAEERKESPETTTTHE